MSKTELLTSLLCIMDDESSNYELLLVILDVEKEVLIRSNLQELIASNTRKELIVRKSLVLERSRRDVLREIGAALNIQDSRITMSLLIKRVEGAQKEKLEELWHRLSNIIQDVLKKNKSNQFLAAASAGYVNSWAQLLQNLMHPAAAYGSSGKFANNVSYGRILNSIG
ncbi:MAG: flagellar protein FlgN [Deltaproteobacteria bacterium]|nr:flagellar protein FlgN [Deltaproteobacteria bacterium]